MPVNYQMHAFQDLLFRSTSFTLNALKSLNNELLDSLGELANTTVIKNLQMVQLQKVILAVGMFSIFDSELQKSLSCKNGFIKAREILYDKGEIKLKNRFEYFSLAINILKHGQGRSYETLIQNYQLLPFEIITPGSSFFKEGDVTEVDTLIKVDDKFVMNCAELLTQVSKAVLD